MNDFDVKVREATGRDLHCADIETIQVNVGLKCNLQCAHCHVASSPKRKEMMSWETMESVIDAVVRGRCQTVDITGGAPELNPHLRRFIESVRAVGARVLVRTNLTVLLEPVTDGMPQFFKDQSVELVASLPCYLEENVDSQRGGGVFEDSIRALRLLNGIGYGVDSSLLLNLVYNPVGAHLPPDQAGLERDYRSHLKAKHDVSFTRLIAITNMPIGRYVGDLKKQKKYHAYTQLLRDAFNPDTIDGLMCRHQINVDWNGIIYDCDFNLALKLAVDHGAPIHIRDFDPHLHGQRRIVTGAHCFGCTAGRGSSCGGTLV